MQLYTCPQCGAKEPGRHRDTCSLAGHLVWPGYNPPDWSEASAFLATNVEEWRRIWPGKVVVINAKTLEYKVVDTDKQAFNPDNPPFGKAPATGHQLLVRRLLTDKEFDAIEKRKLELSDSPA